jgi:threonine dehydrogenase-like Zn-dependent dehydrogenase
MFAPYIVMPQEWVHKLPKDATFSEGALVEPLAVAVHAIKRAGLRLGHSAAIFGAGPIGLLVLYVARLAGAGQVFSVDLRDFRLDVATRFGASQVINALREESRRVINEATGGQGVDRAFEAVGLERTLADTMSVLKPGGTAVVLGLFENGDARIPVNMIQSREITLVGSRGYCWDFQDALAVLESGAAKLRELVTHVMPLTELQRAFELLLDPMNHALKVVIEVS